MLTTVRRLSKSWFAAIIIGLLIVGLAVVGMFDPMRFDFSRDVIKAGDREVSQPEFRRIIDNLNERNAQMTGQRFTMTELVESGQHLQILEGLAGEEGLFAWVWRVGLRPARELVAARIRQQQAFFDPVTGRFDEDSMAQALAEAGMTPADYEETLRDQIAAEHYVAGVGAGFRLPRVYGAMLAAYAGETRDGRWVLLMPEDVGPLPDPTDAQLTELRDEFAEQLREPEVRTVTLVRFTPSLVADQVEVTEQQIQDRFEFQRDTLGTPETRSFVTLTAANAAAAQTLVRRLRAGEDPADVAESLNIEPVVYDDQPRSAVADAAVAQAAFGLAAGQVSGPVESELGLVVVKVTEVTAGEEATLEAHRAEIAEALRMEAARVRVSEMVARFDELRNEGVALEEAASQTGGVVDRVGPFNEAGVTRDGREFGPLIGETAFETAQGSVSDIVDAGQDQYFVLRVEQVTPARMPSIEELRAELTQAWRSRELGRRMQERGSAIAERVRGGQDIAAVAEAEGLSLVTREDVGRDAGEGEGALGQGVLDGLFGQGRGQVFAGPADEEGRFVIGVVDAISPPAAVLAGRQAEQFRGLLAQQFEPEIMQAIQAAAREAVDVRTYPDRARAALGVPPEEEPAEGASGGE